MEKKSKATPQKAPFRLQTETLRRLDDSQMKEVAGGARLWRPGFSDDTTSTYDDTAG